MPHLTVLPLSGLPAVQQGLSSTDSLGCHTCVKQVHSDELHLQMEPEEPGQEGDVILGVLGVDRSITSPYGNNGGFWYVRLQADF